MIHTWRIFFTIYGERAIEESSVDVPAPSAADALVMFGVNHPSFPPKRVIVPRQMEVVPMVLGVD